MKLSMYIGSEFALGQRTGFDFNVDLTENEMRELAREFLNNEDACKDFEAIKKMYEPLYQKIRSHGREVLDDEIIAIRWHMGAWDLSLHSYEAQKNFVEVGSLSPLVPLLQTADTLAAIIVEKGK